MIRSGHTRAFFLTFIFLCAFTLTGGNVLHSAVPHEHGLSDSHGQVKESPIWHDLHSALRHDKKSFAILTETFTLLVLCLGVPLVAFAFFEGSRAFLEDPVLGRMLRRGIVAHRAFR